MTKPRRILITGPPGSGKTTLIKRLARRTEGPRRGFFTSEIRQGRSRTGFEIETFSGDRARLAGIDLDSPYRVSKYGVDLVGFERLALPEMEAALREKSPLIIDEIGKMELFSSAFKERLLEAFASDLRILATIMIAPNPFCNRLKKWPDTELVIISRQNRDILPGQVEAML